MAAGDDDELGWLGTRICTGRTATAPTFEVDAGLHCWIHEMPYKDEVSEVGLASNEV